MDPVTAGLLIAGAGTAAASGIGQILGGRKQAKYNKERLDELLARRERGDLGLSGEQEALLSRQLNDPAKAAAQQQQQRSELMEVATGGGASGADLSRLRTERARTVTGAAQNAALQIAGADEAARRQQEAEIEARFGARTARNQQNLAAITNAAAQTAGAVGQISGSTPGAATGSTLWGSMFGSDERAELRSLAQQDPQRFIELFLQATGG